MGILAEEIENRPVTITLKAETAMQLIVASIKMPQIPSDEIAKIRDALMLALGI
jgi:hypothetical protein